jgi:hypothetical protein
MKNVRKCSCGKEMTDDQTLLFAMFQGCTHDNESVKEKENESDNRTISSR